MPSPTLAKLNQDNNLNLQFPADDKDTSYLEQELCQISAIEKEHKLSLSELLILKKYKHFILKGFETKLKILNNEKLAIVEIQPETTLTKISRKMTYWFLLVVGLTMDGIGAFLGMQELLSLIPFLSNPAVIGFSLFLGLVNCAMFYSFEAGMLRESLGLTSLDEFDLLISADASEITIAESINTLIKKLIPVLPLNEFKTYINTAAAINNNVLDKKTFYAQELKENFPERIVRHGITVIGAVMISAGSYFMMGALLTAVAASIIGTPLGWGLIGLGIATNLCYFLTMRGKAMVGMLNPVIYKHKQTQDQLKKFKPETIESFDELYKEQTAIRNHKQIVTELEKNNQNLKTQLVLEVHLGTKLTKPIPELVRKSHSMFREAVEKKSANAIVQTVNSNLIAGA